MKSFRNWLTSNSLDVQVSGFDSCAESALQRREADWAEGEPMAALALSMGYPTAACATEHLASTQSCCIPPTFEQVIDIVSGILPQCQVPQCWPSCSFVIATHGSHHCNAQQLHGYVHFAPLFSVPMGC